MSAPDAVVAWWAALEQRHLSDLTFQEVRKALQALSSIYVERRGEALGRGDGFLIFALGG